MECPNCGWNMDNKSFNYYDPIADWDMDYPPRLHEEYFCKVCGMKYLNGEWIIPKEYLPSKKQEDTIRFIVCTLRVENPYPLTKRNAWKFISDNLDKALNRGE